MGVFRNVVCECGYAHRLEAGAAIKCGFCGKDMRFGDNLAELTPGGWTIPAVDPLTFLAHKALDSGGLARSQGIWSASAHLRRNRCSLLARLPRRLRERSVG